MRTTRVCPKCDGRRFFDVERVTFPDPRYKNGVSTFAVATHDQAFWSDKKGGEVERYATVRAFVCAGCGYLELYTPDLETLEHMAKEGVSHVRVVEGTHGE